MPAGFVLVVVFPISGRLGDKLSPGLLIGLGLAVFAYSSWLSTEADAGTSARSRIGLGLVFPALSADSSRVPPPARLEQGSAR